MKHGNEGPLERRLRTPVRAFVLGLALCALAITVAACGSSKKSSSSSSSSTSTPAGTTSSAPASNAGQGTPAQVQALLDDAFGPGTTKIGDLDPTAQEAFKIAAQPPTPAETTTVQNCLKQSPCDLGHPNGKLKIAEVEDVDNPYFKTFRAVVALAAVREPTAKTLYFTQASFKVPQALANFRSMISQGVNVIVGSFDLGPAMLPVVKQAAAKGITVEAATQSIKGAKFDGSDLAGDVLANLCQYGKDLVATSLKAGKKIAIFTGPAGNSYAAQWQPCAKQAIKAAGANLVVDGNTNWTPQGEQQAAASLAAKGLPDASIYDYTTEAFVNKFIALGKTPPTMVGGSVDMAAYKAWKDAQSGPHKFTHYEAPSEVAYGYVQLHAAVKKHNGGDVTTHIVMPQPLVNLTDIGKYYNPKFPGGANFGTALPADILQAAFAG